MRTYFLVFCTVMISMAIISFWHSNKQDVPKAKNETVYDRVMRTQTIRCGYVPRHPVFSLDPNTGELSGVMYDITNELGKRLGLTIDWVEETSFADLVLGLKGNRFDMFCSSIYVIAKRAREIDYSSRIMYESASIYARKDDPRFDSHETMPNINTLRFAVMEGAISYYLLSDHFPGVERHAIQENAPYAQAMMDVVAKKADAVIFPDMDASVYERHNPGQIKVIPAYRHLALFTVAYAMKRDEDAFRRMIDNALTEMHDQQIIRNVLQRYPDILDVVLLEKESGR